MHIIDYGWVRTNGLYVFLLFHRSGIVGMVGCRAAFMYLTLNLLHDNKQILCCGVSGFYLFIFLLILNRLWCWGTCAVYLLVLSVVVENASFGTYFCVCWRCLNSYAIYFFRWIFSQTVKITWIFDSNWSRK